MLGIAVSSLAWQAPLCAQEPAEPILSGQAFLGSEPLPSITVVLHSVAPDEAGEVDSIASGSDGTFAFRLPHVPDPERLGEIFFASVRYRDVLYFGPPISQAVQLDSAYVIQAYDTTAAPAGGARLPVRVRNVFLESSDDGWQVTDLFQVHNPGERTMVARPDDVTWAHPLLVGARDMELGQGDLAPEQVDFAEGLVRVTAPLPPGDRLVVVRYRLDDLETVIPIVGLTERAEVLVQEPAPLLEVMGLESLDTVELEPGSSYRRYQGSALQDAAIHLLRTEAPTGLPTQWLAVLLALVLAGAGVLAFRRSGPAPATAGGAGSAPAGPLATRQQILLEIARLDESNGSGDVADPEAEDRYRARRAELLRRLDEESSP